MLSRAQNTFHHNPRFRGPVSSSNESSTTNSGFPYFCPYSNQFNSNLLGNHKTFNKPKLYQKWRFFFYFALILTKTQPKKFFFLSIFALNLAKALQQRGLFLYFCTYSSQSPTKNGVFLSFCTYSYQRHTMKGRFLYFALILPQKPTKKVFFFYLSLILTKALPLFLYFALILTIALFF